MFITSVKHASRPRSRYNPPRSLETHLRIHTVESSWRKPETFHGGGRTSMSSTGCVRVKCEQEIFTGEGQNFSQQPTEKFLLAEARISRMMESSGGGWNLSRRRLYIQVKYRMCRVSEDKRWKVPWNLSRRWPHIQVKYRMCRDSVKEHM